MQKKKKNLGTDFTYFKNNPSKWITELTIKGKTINLLEDDMGENQPEPEHGNHFLDKHKMINKRKNY